MRPILLLVPLLLCCSSADNDADALWERLMEGDYRGWARAPGFDIRQPSETVHGREVDIYVNDVMVGALASSGSTAWPEGALIVKDAWRGEGELLHVVAMEKVGGDWFWAEWEPDGEVLYAGSPSVCTGCHAPGADSVLAFGFP